MTNRGSLNGGRIVTTGVVPQSQLHIVPCTLAQANQYVQAHHRHHGPSPISKFAVAVADEAGLVRGVAILGLPKARLLMDGWTLEVTRVATDGCPNACSALYGAARRIVREMGYGRLVTYILDTEPGTALKASGWTFDGEVGGGDWWRPSRPTVSRHTPLSMKRPKGRWSVLLRDARPSVEWPSVPGDATEPLFTSA